MKNKLLFLFIGLVYFNISAQCWQSVSAGGAHTVGIKTGGTLWSWGLNDNGQLGDGSMITFTSTPVQVGTASNWLMISAGNSHNIGIQNDGTLWAWGKNIQNQLGNGSVVNSNIPLKIGSDTDWKYVCSGDEYSLAIKNNGTLWAWGKNDKGQLGDNTTIVKTIPTQIGSDSWLFVSAGTDHTLGVKSNGTLWAWGRNNNGKLGDNTTVDKIMPIQIGTDTDWLSAMASSGHSVAIKTTGSLWTWGNNTNGQLGDNTTVVKYVPINIGAISGGTSISKGLQHSIVRKNDGTLWSWGGNASGQLGDGTVIQKTSPVQIVGSATDWQSISARVTHTVALKTDGSLYSWGSNLSGQLGLGGPISAGVSTPTVVVCPTLAVKENTVSSKLTIYPNPTNSILNINNDNIVFDKITISDLYGKIVFESKLNLSEINVSNLASGMYIIQGFSYENNYNSKFVKN
jgi:alpha-tubulin suppressor-like RCC1 family protein